MSFWKKKKAHHPPASSFLGKAPKVNITCILTFIRKDEPVFDTETAGLPHPAISSTTTSELDGSEHLIAIDTANESPETSAATPARNTSTSRRLSKFLPFRRNSAKNTMH